MSCIRARGWQEGGLSNLRIKDTWVYWWEAEPELVFSSGLPSGTSLLYVWGERGEPGCANSLTGGIVPFLLVSWQDSYPGCMVLSTGFPSGEDS